MNAAAAPKLGRYAFEVTEREIGAAQIVAIDLHWALGLSGFGRLVRHVRRVNPSARLVVGGITAGHYAEELLERHPIDFVVRGDAEPTFAGLVQALLEGRSPEGLPNLHGRGLPPAALRRMTQAEFDTTDPLTADWFPTYERVSTWDAVAFPPGRTIPVSRGCPLRCPECYGSHASTFGPGYLLRSPAGLAALVRRAEGMRLRNLRLFLGKPPRKKLNELLRGLAAAGPYRFDSTVGFYLCRPPAVEDLALLEAAFPRATISMVPPSEHVPGPRPRELAEEEQQWRQVAAHVAVSDTLSLDAWTTVRGKIERAREVLGIAANTSRVKVGSGAVWSVTRPCDGACTGSSFEAVEEAVQPLWTFYAARLLSPALAELLEPFRFLDELEAEPPIASRPPGPMGVFFDRLTDNWRRHRLPTLPGLEFRLCRLRTRADSLPRAPHGPHGPSFSGVLGYVPAGQFELEATQATVLGARMDHRGVELSGALPGGPGEVVGIFPSLEQPSADEEWLRAVSSAGVVALRVGSLPTPLLDAGEPPLQVRVLLRVQEAHVGVFNGAAEPLARGAANLGYFRIRAPAPVPPS